MPPFFAIGVTTYNRREMLQECLDSILAQTFTDFEVIVGNDYLEDQLYLHEFGIDDRRVNIVNHEKNLGEVVNMNWLLHQAKGRYFTWLADDDLMHPEFLHYANLAFQGKSAEAVTAFFSDYDYGPEPKRFPSIARSGTEITCFSLKDFLQVYLSQKNGLIGCYGAMRLDVLKKFGGMKNLGSGFSPYGDSVLPLLLAEHGEIAYLPEKLIFLRTHENSLSCKSDDFNAYISAEDDFITIVKDICKKHGLHEKKNDFLYYLVRWFSHNEWAVLKRNHSLSSRAVLIAYWQRQFYLVRTQLPYSLTFRHLSYLSRRVVVHFVKEFLR
jgi:glycosyltransferase involved in cell wall biosynthesis